MADDPTIQWHQATRFGIEIDAAQNAWHTGHVTDVVPLADTPDSVIVATETGGVWVIVGSSNPLPLSDSWDKPDVHSLTLGPDAPRHVFAGCANVYSNDPSSTATAPVVMETDLSTLAPLLNWLPITPALPATAGRVMRIAVLMTRRRIVVACAKILADDTGGIFWADIPPARFSPSDPPRGPYVWKQAKIADIPSPNGFWNVAVASRLGQGHRDRLENLDEIVIVAGGFKGGGLYFGRWDASGDLAFRRSTVAFGDGGDATSIFFQNCGTTSVSSCAGIPNIVYAASAWPDGRLNTVLRSQDGGRHWIFCKAIMANPSGPLDLLVARTGEQGAKWNNCIAAHPGNPGMAALGWQGGSFLTLNSGAEWRPINGSVHLHPDVHGFLFQKEVPDSIGNLYICSDGGLARVNLDEWLGLVGQPFRSDYNRSLPVLQCYSNLIRQFYGCMGASSKRFGLVATGLQDNGNVSCTLAPLEPWRHEDEGDGGWNAFLNDDTYARNIMGEPVVTTTVAGPGGLVSVSGVVPITKPAPVDPGGLKGPVAEPVIRPRFRNNEGRIMLAVASSGATVYGLFSDEAVPPKYGFERLGAIPPAEAVSALASFQGERVFVGTSGGKIYSLNSSTGAVAEQSVKLPKPSPSTRMKDGAVVRIVGFSDGEMFAALVNATEGSINPTGPVGVFTPLTPPLIQTYVIAFDGTGWTYTPGIGLPNAPIYGMVAVAAPQTRVPRALLVALDAEVYISRDDGKSWQRASAGLPRRPHCADLRFASRAGEGGMIFLSTYGRSLWTATV